MLSSKKGSAFNTKEIIPIIDLVSLVWMLLTAKIIPIRQLIAKTTTIWITSVMDMIAPGEVLSPFS